MQSTLLDDLEIKYGRAILSNLTAQPLTRNGERVRLFDQTRHSSEHYYRADRRGKPYIMDWQSQKRVYPVTAYCELYGVDFKTALSDLCQQYGLSSDTSYTPRQRPTLPTPSPAVIDFLPVEVYQRCRTQFDRNGLFIHLCQFFNRDTAAAIFEQYRLGTSRHWQFAGTLATCLPQFDRAGNLRQVKLIAFHPQTGRRAKRPDPAEQWNEQAGKYEPCPPDTDKSKVYGRYIFGKAYQACNLQQCYFGEHLLTTQPDKAVAIVEGESTALVMSAIWPEYIWLATGGATGGSWDASDKFNVLQGRKVVLWPDSGKYADWSVKAETLQGIAAELSVSRYVEDAAPKPNLDLRDLLTWPRWNLKGQTIYGDVLEVEPCSGYPPFWDDPPAPNAVPVLRVQSAADWLVNYQTERVGLIRE